MLCQHRRLYSMMWIAVSTDLDSLLGVSGISSNLPGMEDAKHVSAELHLQCHIASAAASQQMDG